MSAVAEVLHPFIEETGRATAGSHSLLGDNVGHILFALFFFFFTISQHSLSVTISVYLHH